MTTELIKYHCPNCGGILPGPMACPVCKQPARNTIHADPTELADAYRELAERFWRSRLREVAETTKKYYGVTIRGLAFHCECGVHPVSNCGEHDQVLIVDHPNVEIGTRRLLNDLEVIEALLDRLLLEHVSHNADKGRLQGLDRRVKALRERFGLPEDGSGDEVDDEEDDQ